MAKIRFGVAGAGVFGNFHANKVRGDERATLVGILDHDLARAEALSHNHNCRGFDNIDEFLSEIDALVVAVPAIYHFEVAKAALSAGKHCLVEKPIAPIANQAQELVEIARANNAKLQIGHQERYIFKAMGLLDIVETPQYLEAYRIGLPSPRGADVSATLDLMVHDIDLAALLFRSEPEEITATRLSGKPENPDAIEAHITYKNGGKAKFVASRASDTRDRRMNIDYQNGKVAIDFFAKTFENTAAFELHDDYTALVPDAMQAATSDFISAILGEKPIWVTGEDGLAAVKIANAIDAASLK